MNVCSAVTRESEYLSEYSRDLLARARSDPADCES